MSSLAVTSLSTVVSCRSLVTVWSCRYTPCLDAASTRKPGTRASEKLKTASKAQGSNAYHLVDNDQHKWPTTHVTSCENDTKQFKNSSLVFILLFKDWQKRNAVNFYCTESALHTWEANVLFVNFTDLIRLWFRMVDVNKTDIGFPPRGTISYIWATIFEKLSAMAFWNTLGNRTWSQCVF